MEKKVLLVIIDALASEFIRPAMENGRLPTLEKLAAAGGCCWNCTSVFPSITPAATAALVSGDYPAQHGIGGAYFYIPETGDVEYYGDDVWIVAKEGFAEYFRGFQWRLNYERLRSRTLYEMIEATGRRSLCLNYMWFKGPVEHEMRVPLLMKLLPGVPAAPKVYGPTYLALGDFVHSLIPGSSAEFNGSRGIFGRFGFQDESTRQYLLQIAERGVFPDFTLAYFPDNDFRSHESGPAEAVSAVENVDKTLEEVIDRLGGLDRFLDEFAIVVTGDHSQSYLRDDGDAGIQMDEVLEGFTITPAGKSWGTEDDVMVCSNLRAAEIYLRPGAERKRKNLVDALLRSNKIDLVFWEMKGNIPQEFCVVSASRGELRFRSAYEESRSTVTDPYGLRWTWTGDLDAIDAEIDSDGRLKYHEYPNAMQRISTAFTDAVDSLWVSARPGYEFQLPGTSMHNRGSHGALHHADSTSPLLTAGFPDHIDLPEEPRITDVALLCLQALGMSGRQTNLDSA